jgi:CRP-like cAMP-binding protein
MVRFPALAPDPAEPQFSIALFHHLDETVIDSILNAAQHRHYLRGQFFCRQGEAATSLYALSSGQAKVSGITSAGKEVLLDWMHPGEVWGVGSLLSSEMSYLWTVSATKDSEALVWDKITINQFAGRWSILSENALRITLRWAHQLQKRFEELATETVESRILSRALSLARRNKDRTGVAEIDVSDEELAQMAGTNLFSVNRVLKSWHRLGYVSKTRGRLLILDKENLLRICHSSDDDQRD